MDKVDPDPSLKDRLTERQREILACMAQGLTNPEIASCLFISQRSVEREITRARRAYKVKSREVLLLLAFQAGVVTEDHLKVHLVDSCDTCHGDERR